MIKSELIRVINYIENDKNIKREILFEALEDALLKAAHRTYGRDKDLIVRIDRDEGDISLFYRKKVVEEDPLEQYEIILEDAIKYNAEAKTGDYINIPIDKERFGRIAAQVAKQVIYQKISEAEKESLFDVYRNKLKTNITGTIHRIESDAFIVKFDQIEAVLLKREVVRGENFRIGDIVKANIVAVRHDRKEIDIYLSRSNAEFLTRLIELEVPEIQDGVIEIINTVRDAGNRAKIAVKSNDPRVDSVGACVGMRGIRIQSVKKEIGGEKIDIVQYSENIKEFIKNAISPATIISINEISEDSVYEVVVPDKQLSLAIGKGGKNVKLAAKLVKKRIDIISESDKKKQEMKRFFAEKNEIKEMQNIKGLNEKLAASIVRSGYTFNTLGKASKEDLMQIRGMTDKTAEKIISYFGNGEED